MQCLMLLLNIHNAEKQYPNLIQTLLVFQETTNTLMNAVGTNLDDINEPYSCCCFAEQGRASVSRVFPGGLLRPQVPGTAGQGVHLQGARPDQARAHPESTQGPDCTFCNNKTSF